MSNSYRDGLIKSIGDQSFKVEQAKHKMQQAKITQEILINEYYGSLGELERLEQLLLDELKGKGPVFKGGNQDGT